MTDTGKETWDKLCRLAGLPTDEEEKALIYKNMIENWLRRASLEHRALYHDTPEL